MANARTTRAAQAARQAKLDRTPDLAPCHRCGNPIERWRRFPDPWSITVEHIIEIDAGGPAADETNLAVSHLRCNSSAGASYGNNKLGRNRARRTSSISL